MTPQVGTAIGETLADLVLRAEQAERERDQACEGESLRAQERDEARFNASTYESAATKALAELDAMKQTVKAYAKSRDEATDEAEKAEARVAALAGLAGDIRRVLVEDDDVSPIGALVRIGAMLDKAAIDAALAEPREEPSR